MYRNQYLLVKGDCVKPFASITPIPVGPFTLYPGPSLSWHFRVAEDRFVLLIGEAFDPLLPQNDPEETADHLLHACVDVGSFLQEVQHLAGRHVILFGDATSTVAINDAIGQRQIYFGDSDAGLVLTSSPKMFFHCFNLVFEVPEDTKPFVTSRAFLRNEFAWYGDEFIDPRLRKVLPNHYLDLRRSELKRLQLSMPRFIDRERSLDFSCAVLRGTFEAMALRYQLIQAVTAGWDSRVLLAASRLQKQRIKYFVFDDAGSEVSTDARIAGQLCKNLHLDFQRVERPSLREDFLQSYRQEYLIPRVLYTTSHIQYHRDTYARTSTVVNVNGNGGEIARCYFGTSDKHVSLGMLTTFTGYGDRFPRATKAIARWMDSAVPYAQSHGIALLDLFYWEQRMGNWAAHGYRELDQALETISPFNHRGLLLALLSLPVKERAGQRSPLFRELAARLWPEVLEAPVNPDERRLPAWLKTHSHLRYLAKAALLSLLWMGPD